MLSILKDCEGAERLYLFSSLQENEILNGDLSMSMYNIKNFHTLSLTPKNVFKTILPTNGWSYMFYKYISFICSNALLLNICLLLRSCHIFYTHISSFFQTNH